jgi:hypothetical protein
MQNYFINILSYKSSNVKIINANQKISAKLAFIKTEAEFKRLNTIANNKNISNENIANVIFKQLKGNESNSVIVNFINNHFFAAYKTLVELRQIMEKQNCFDYRGIKKYGYLINTILFDVIPFAENIGKRNNINYIFFNGSKSNIEHTNWHYLGTKHLFYNCTFNKSMLDDKLALILSPVALRQTIELKMQRIIGVADYYDLNGQKIFVKHHFFFDFIKKNKSHFIFEDININIIQKIFEFCNQSVHKGVMPFIWQMNYAFKYIDPLIYNSQDNFSKNWNICGSVKIKDFNTLQSNLQIELEEKFKRPEYNLYIERLTNPEAEIISL